jgi:hypothetical protein
LHLYLRYFLPHVWNVFYGYPEYGAFTEKCVGTCTIPEFLYGLTCKRKLCYGQCSAFRDIHSKAPTLPRTVLSHLHFATSAMHLCCNAI